MNSEWPVSHYKPGNGRIGPISQSEKNGSEVYPWSDVMLEEGVYTNNSGAAVLVPNRFRQDCFDFGPAAVIIRETAAA